MEGITAELLWGVWRSSSINLMGKVLFTSASGHNLLNSYALSGELKRESGWEKDGFIFIIMLMGVKKD